MGMNLLRRSCDTNPTEPAPNPSRFTVVREHEVGMHWVAMIHYPGCTNFEGHKVVLGKGPLPSTRARFDPHFEEGGDVVARFAPTADGYAMAMGLAAKL